MANKYKNNFQKLKMKTRLFYVSNKSGSEKKGKL